MISLALLLLQSESDFWSVEHFPLPEGEILEVGGMDFGPKGDLWLSTRRGQLWRLESPLGDPAAARWSLFAEGLQEGLGLKWHEDKLYVVQRGELSELFDNDDDGTCDGVRTITQNWGMSGNYHEFAFGLPVDARGNFWVSLNVGFWSPEWWHGLSQAPYRGWILKISPDGQVTPVAAGARSPCGLGIGPEGDVFYTDNQGDWMPVCPIFHVEQDDWFGHPASLRWTPEYGNGERRPSSTEPAARQRKPAAILIPYKWSRSAVNLVMDESGGKFGPFAGQMIVGELTNGMLLRVDMEKVQGQWQGVVWPLRQDVGSICRVAQASDGSLFTGFTNRGWGGLSPGHGLARVRFTGREPFEVASVRQLKDGFALRFTQPADLATLQAASATVVQYDYFDWWDYGSPQQNLTPRAIAAFEADADGLGARLRVTGLAPAMCAEVILAGVRSVDGESLLHPEFHATINQLPDSPRTEANVTKRVTAPVARADNPEGWLHLTWSDPFGQWQGNGEGWQLVDADVDPAEPRQFAVRPGTGALVNGDGRAPDLVTQQEFGDLDFRFQFMLPQGGDGGLFFMERYELQLVDAPYECGGIINGKNPRQAAYRGPGQWHVVTGRFRAPRFDPATGAKIAHARFENVALDGVITVPAADVEEITPGGLRGEAPRGALRFQGHAGRIALGDVRVKLLDEAFAHPDWQSRLPQEAQLAAAQIWPLEGEPLPPAFELRARASWTGAGADFFLSPELTFPWCGGGGEAPKLGSLVEMAGAEAAVLTELVPEGVSFETVLRCRPAGEGRALVQVFVNGMQTAEAEVAVPTGGWRVAGARARKAGGLRLTALDVRALRE